MAGSGKTGSTSLRNKLHKMQTQKVIVSILFLCVPLLLLFTFTYLPFFKMVQFSFYDMKYIGKRTWVGLQNYISVFTREDCLNALKLSLFYLVGSFVQIAIALLFASILSFPTKGGKFFRGALYFPSLIGGIAVGFIFKFFFTHGFVLDTLLTWVGMDADSLPFWLKDKSINNWVLAATSIWRYMGQNMVLFIGALNLILAVSGALSAFEMPYVITDGGFGTSTYFVLMNKIAHTNQKVGLASAMAVVLLALILLVTAVQKIVERRMDSDTPRRRKRRVQK